MTLEMDNFTANNNPAYSIQLAALTLPPHSSFRRVGLNGLGLFDPLTSLKPFCGGKEKRNLHDRKK